VSALSKNHKKGEFVPLITQTVKKNYRSNDVVMSAGDVTVFTGLLEGIISVFDEKSAGGVDLAITPSEFRARKFGVSRKADSLSCTVSLKHIKAGKHEIDVFNHVALFDADYKSALTATRINQIYQGAKA
jgi:hypothetical protein